MQGPALKP